MKLRVRCRPVVASPEADAPIRVDPARLVVRARPMRILDLDCEARPLHWIGGDYVSKEVTAIAWAWTDRPDDVTCYTIGDTDPIVMLQAFCRVFDQADMVTGHYIRGYDLPTINGALTEYQLPTLGDKLAHDTKIDLVIRSGLSSSQENLAAMLRLEHGKVHMDQATWRAANRLTPEGLAQARKRVTGDVRQHIELRQRLIDLNYLAAPRLWRPKTPAPLPAYQP